MTRQALETAWRSPEGRDTPGWEEVQRLRPPQERCLIEAVRQSRGPKDDRRDAFGLADALRWGAIERAVYKERGGVGAPGYRARGWSRW